MKFVSRNITLVFDRYDRNISIKSAERQRRGDNNENSFSIKGDRLMPKYRDFLKSSVNKHNLVIFLLQYLCSNMPDNLVNSEKLVIACGFENGEECRIITHSHVYQNVELSCNHEEADTRLIVHLNEESRSFENIVVQSDDTDVLVVVLYYVAVFSELFRDKKIYVQTGHFNQTTNKLRYIDVNSIASKLGSDFCSYLPAIHALTGCDTTSAIFKIGKKTAFDVAWKKKEQITNFSKFHESNLEDVLRMSRNFVTKLYKHDNIENLDDLRRLITLRSLKWSAELPPTEDAFRQHVLRLVFIIFLNFKLNENFDFQVFIAV